MEKGRKISGLSHTKLKSGLTTSAVRGAGSDRPRRHRAVRRHRRQQTDFLHRIHHSGALRAAVLRSPSGSVRSAPLRSAQPWLYPHRHYLTFPRMQIHETARIRGLSQSELDPPVRTRKTRHQDPARSSGTKCSRHKYSSTVYSSFYYCRLIIVADRLGPLRANLGRIME